MGIAIYSLGAAEEVTGSKHVLEADGSSILVDCGAFQGKRKEADEKNRGFDMDISALSSVVLTHAHYDHCGLLPVLAKRGYHGNIYATPATRDLAALIMMDSAKIQARDAEYLRKQAEKAGREFTWKPLFDEEDVMAVVEQFVTVSYNRPIPDRARRRAFLLRRRAHPRLGHRLPYRRRASGEPLRIAFTGDLGRKNKPIIRDPEPIPGRRLPGRSRAPTATASTSRPRTPSRSSPRSSRPTVERGGKIVIPPSRSSAPRSSSTTSTCSSTRSAFPDPDLRRLPHGDQRDLHLPDPSRVLRRGDPTSLHRAPREPLRLQRPPLLASVAGIKGSSTTSRGRPSSSRPTGCARRGASSTTSSTRSRIRGTPSSSSATWPRTPWAGGSGTGSRRCGSSAISISVQRTGRGDQRLQRPRRLPGDRGTTSPGSTSIAAQEGLPRPRRARGPSRRSRATSPSRASPR